MTTKQILASRNASHFHKSVNRLAFIQSQGPSNYDVIMEGGQAQVDGEEGVKPHVDVHKEN